MARLPLIIVGGGSIGQRHIGVANAHDDVDLVTIIEADSSHRDKLAAQGLPVFARLEDAPPAQAAIIATPTQDHADTALACLDLGLAVLVEKPIAHTIQAAQMLIDRADTLGLPIYVGHHRRCHPFSIAARARLAALGPLIGVQGLWSLRKHDQYFDAPWRRQAGAGPLMTNLSHEVDLLQFLFGEIETVTALTSNTARGLAVEDTATLSFGFASGALGSFLISDAGLSPWSFETATAENPAIAPSDQDYLRILGTAGAMAFPSLTTWSANASPADWTTPLSAEHITADARIDPLMVQLTRFADAVRGGVDDILCTGQQGLSALRVTLASAFSVQQARPVLPGDVPASFDGS